MFVSLKGGSIWDGYREFEIAILDSYQQLQDSGDTTGMDAKVYVVQFYFIQSKF